MDSEKVFIYSHYQVCVLAVQTPTCSVAHSPVGSNRDAWKIIDSLWLLKLNCIHDVLDRAQQGRPGWQDRKFLLWLVPT